MELADRIGRNAGAAVTILHVVPPARTPDLRTLDAQREVDRVFSVDPTQPRPVEFKVLEDNSPVAAVLREAEGFDLVIIGVAEEWGLESHLFGWRPERIARECPSSMLIVRRFIAPAGTSETAKM
jgi:nucleotide-binding universal stress UspA family protein